jgi:hypothetical protein
MWKKVTGILVICAALITSGFVLEDRYNNQKHHDKDLVNERSITTLQLDKVEYQLVMNLKQFQKEQQVSLKAQKRENDYRYYTGVLNNIKRQMSQLRQDIRQQPNNTQLRDDYKYLQQQETQVHNKLNQLMSSN